jgi:predicted NUDIX family phosphoesterase
VSDPSETVAMEEEHVLVVPTRLFRDLGYFQGFREGAEPYLAALTNPASVSYRPRKAMEQDPSFKQLIPYVLFRHIDSSGSESLFQYTRGSGQGEQRLHAKRSVGVGGHISSTDRDHISGDPYREGLRRELDEEVVIGSPYHERSIGLINDDETEVGKVHLGVVHLFDVERPAVQPRESEIIEAGFRPVSELLADLSRFETWSQICLKALFA